MIQPTTKRIAAIQSCYIPWRGFFDFIASVDLFVIYDDVQYSTGTYRNRNQVKTKSGLKWVTVPVNVSLGQAIDEVVIAKTLKPWMEAHQRLLRESLGDTPHFKDAIELWREGTAHNATHLSILNVRLLKLICNYLGIKTPITNARDYTLNGVKTERLMELFRKVGATHYLSGPAARSYLDEDCFRRHSIVLEYKSYEYVPYPQPWGEFAGEVTILDVIANLGSDARAFIRSRSPNSVAVGHSASADAGD